MIRKKQKPILTPYFIFLEEERWKAVVETPELPFAKVSVNAYKKWLNMMFNDKAKIEQYENLSKQIKNEIDAQVLLSQIENQYKPATKQIKKAKKPQKQKPKKAKNCNIQSFE